MATFTITTTQYVSALTGKGGSDTYNVNGGTLITDCDSRYAPNASGTTGPIGNLTVSQSLGGNWTVTTEFTKLIPFDSGIGMVPAYGTVITQGTASATLLCVMSARTGGNVHVGGSVMPISGWLKVRVSTNGFTAGALTGITANATAASEQGWICVVGVEALTHSHSRLGSMQMRGDWFDVGATNGTAGQTLQLPHFIADGGTWYPGVEVETAAGSGVYQFWPNAGQRFVQANVSTDTRSMFVYISTTGVCTFGQGFDGLTAGYVPPTGCRVRVPSINLQNAASASLGVNVEPNRTIGTRYECAFTNAGNLNVSKVTGGWYWNVVQAYGVYIRDLHSCDQILLGECATAMDIDGMHQGLATSATEYGSNGIVIQQSYKGGTIGTMSWLRASQTATSAYSAILVNLYGGWTISKLRGGSVGAATAVAGAVYFNTCGPMTVGELWTFSKRAIAQGADNLKILRHVYADNNVGTTTTTAQSRAVETVGLCKVVTVDSIENWPGVANCHPYLALMFSNTTLKATLRNCGTAAAPYNAGTVNVMAYIWDDGGNNDQITIQRNWMTSLRLGLHGGTNTTRRLISVNNYQVDASKTVGPQQLDSTVHGNRFNSGGVPTSYSAVYGNAMWDGFTGDTTTRAALILVEKTAANANAYVVTAGSPKFTGAGSCVMLNVGDQIVWTWPWKILGWNGLASTAVQGTNTANHTLEYSLDKTGAGFGSWKTLTNANLAAETGIDPVAGFGLRMRVTCAVANSANKLDSLRIDGTTTLALQNAALYPLEGTGLTRDGIVPGSDVVILSAGTTTVLATGDSVGNSSYTYTYLSPHNVDIAIYLQGYEPYYLRNYLLSADPVTLPIAQKIDRNFSLA